MSVNNNFIFRLLNWYDHNQRVLPWRALAGQTSNPYHVWLSEIMLQQTTVQTVRDYFRRFVERWPDLEKLADANLDDVLHAWQGLGYYSRARNLHKCARQVMQDYDGLFPRSYEQLLKLPGIGPYTAAAIAAIAFNQQHLPIDGNIKRVLARVFHINEEFSNLHAFIEAHYAYLSHHDRPGDFAQGLMDLGATICRPKAPSCELCPVKSCCLSYKTNSQVSYPRKKTIIKKPIRYARAFLIIDGKEALLLRQRPEKGLLAGMTEVPSEPWQTVEQVPAIPEMVRTFKGRIKHVFTHFQLYLDVHQVKKEQVPSELLANTKSVPISELQRLAIPTLFKKVLTLI